MSAPSAKKQAVAVKGLRRSERSASCGTILGPFRGCRDSPSAVRSETMQRAVKSRRLHHRVILETPLMHRHVLEEYLECLWEDSGDRIQVRSFL